MISYSAIQNDISFTGGDYVDKGGSSLEPHSDSELSTSSNSPSESELVEQLSSRHDRSEESLIDSESPDSGRGESSGSSVLHPAISSGDFGKVLPLKANRKLTEHEKFILLTKHFIPPRSYKFPVRFVSGRDRCFQHSWLAQYNGLVYSESEDGGFCKYCVLFAVDGPAMELGILVNRPLIDF